MEFMKNLLIVLGAVAATIGVPAAWITAIVTTAKNDDIAMLIIDLMLPPAGVIHGLLIWFT